MKKTMKSQAPKSVRVPKARKDKHLMIMAHHPSSCRSSGGYTASKTSYSHLAA
jgi:hypothetical protein